MHNLVLSSGGGVGAWQCGVLHSLVQRPHFEGYKEIAGASIGALNAAFLAQFKGKPEDAQKAWAGLVSKACDEWVSSTVPFPRINMRWMNALCCGEGYLADPKFLDDLVDRISFCDVETSNIVLHIAVTNWRGIQEIHNSMGSLRRECVCCTKRLAKKMRNKGDTPKVFHTAEELKGFVRASMSIPIVFPAVKMMHRMFFDGALSSPVPKVVFFERRPLDILITHPRRKTDLRKIGSKTMSRKITDLLNVLMMNSGNNVVDNYIQTTGHPVTVVRPQKMYPNTTKLDVETSKTLIKDGKRDGLNSHAPKKEKHHAPREGKFQEEASPLIGGTRKMEL